VHGAEAAKDSAGLRYDPDILDLADVGVRTAQLCYRTFSRASSSLPSRRAAPRRAAPSGAAPGLAALCALAHKGNGVRRS